MDPHELQQRNQNKDTKQDIAYLVGSPGSGGNWYCPDIFLPVNFNIPDIKRQAQYKNEYKPSYKN